MLSLKNVHHLLLATSKLCAHSSCLRQVGELVRQVSPYHMDSTDLYSAICTYALACAQVLVDGWKFI